MNPKLILGLGLALFIYVAEVSGRSVSKEENETNSCKEKIFQPDSVEELNTSNDFEPIGDACGCTKVRVPSAPVHAPKYYKEHEPEPEEVGRYIKAPNCMNDFGSHEDQTSDEKLDHDVPVDIVSLHLAQQIERKAETSKTEQRLFYGFETLPDDRPMNKKHYEEVPEGDLYTFSKKIVELKPDVSVIPCGEDADDQVYVKKGKHTSSYLRYGDIGYAPVQGASSKFVKKSCRYRTPKEYEYYSHENEGRRYKKHHYSDEVLTEPSYEESYEIPVKKNCGCGH